MENWKDVVGIKMIIYRGWWGRGEGKEIEEANLWL